MEQELLDNLREQYYQAISEMMEEKDILEALPTPDFPSFFPLMEGIIINLDNYLEELENFLPNVDNQEDYDFIMEQLELTSWKKDVCTERLLEAETILPETKQATGKKKKLIFATTAAGNIYIEKDIMDQSLSEEYYERIIESIEDLTNRVSISNPEKSRTLVANQKLAGIQEIKKFQIRLLYKHLPNDYEYVMMVTKKKDTLTRNYKVMLNQRNERTSEEYKIIKDILLKANPEEIASLEERNTEIAKRIINYLSENKRGGKGEK